MVIDPLYRIKDERLSAPKLVAVDTETTRFDEPVYGWKKKTRIKPFGGHQLVLGSIAGEGHVSIYHRRDLCQRVYEYLSSGYHIVFHHCAFDIPVICAAAPDLFPDFVCAVDEGRIHDTKILEVLIQIAVGSRAMGSKQLVTSPTLQDLARKRAAVVLNKDQTVRLGFDRFLIPGTPIPESYLRYAAEDARATYLVYRSQFFEAGVLKQPSFCKFPIFRDAEAKFGLLSEQIQIKGALAFEWLERFPIRVDIPKAYKTREKLEHECKRMEEALVSYGWAKRGKKTKRFQLSFKKIRALLSTYSTERGITPEYTPTGVLSIEHDFWTRHLPTIRREVYSSPDTAETLEEKLSVWLRYQRGRKLLSTYIYVYSSAERHYPRYNNIGARTGRTACDHPNVQNIPKRHDGIRALFIPEPGHQFLEGDFKFAELCALAQIYRNLYGGSVLEVAINAGEDPHVATARRLIPNFDALSEEERKVYRQAAKAVNFGLPGGLGAKTFRKYAEKSFQFKGTEIEIKELRQKALSSDPQLSLYLDDKYSMEGRLSLVAHNLNMSLSKLIDYFEGWDEHVPNKWNAIAVRNRIYDWIQGTDIRHVPVPLGVDKRFDLFRQCTCTLTGRVRDRASYTEAHNTPFQGLVGDAGKLALWHLYKAWQANPCFKPVAFIHDSVLVQALPSAIEETGRLLVDAMMKGITEVCPDITCGVDLTKPLDRWGKNTNPWGEEEKEEAQ